MRAIHNQQLSKLSVHANSGHGQQAYSRNSELCQKTRPSIILVIAMNTAGKLEEQEGMWQACPPYSIPTSLGSPVHFRASR